MIHFQISDIILHPTGGGGGGRAGFRSAPPLKRPPKNSGSSSTTHAVKVCRPTTWQPLDLYFSAPLAVSYSTAPQVIPNTFSSAMSAAHGTRVTVIHFLEGSSSDEITDIEYKPVISTSKPGAFPSELRAKRSNVQANDEVLKEASIERTCPNCSNPEMLYHTKQLRSADEGTTVFYTCPKCGFKYVQSFLGSII